MCGRFTLTHDAKYIEQTFDVSDGIEFSANYNITPTQSIPVIWQTEAKSRKISLMHWGLIPHWSTQPSSKYIMINARADTLAEKPSYRDAYQHRRCLIPADGFFEWHTETGKKQPYYILMHEHRLFAFAGLWECWQGEQTLHSCTVITTEANSLIQGIHDRMPVILQTEDYDNWLNPDIQQASQLNKLLKPYAGTNLKMYPVSSEVNYPGNNHPGLIQELS